MPENLVCGAECDILCKHFLSEWQGSRRTKNAVNLKMSNVKTLPRHYVILLLRCTGVGLHARL